MTGHPWRKVAYYVLPALIWMAVMYGGSSDIGSNERTQPVINGLLLRLFPFLADYFTAEQLSRINWNLRKTAHVTEYAVLAILLFRAVAFGNPRFRSRNAALPLVLAISFAFADEYHQSFVPSRGPSTTDVFFDATGAVIGVLLCLWRHCLQNTKAPDPAKG